MMSSPMSILLVEDNLADVKLVQEAMSAADIQYEIKIARHGQEALELLKPGTFRPDMIFLDLNLPIMDGRELLEILKQSEILRTIPVVILTTSAAEEDVRRSYELHANCYIKKPDSFEQFIDVVKQIESFWLSVVRLPSSDMG